MQSMRLAHGGLATLHIALLLPDAMHPSSHVTSRLGLNFFHLPHGYLFRAKYSVSWDVI